MVNALSMITALAAIAGVQAACPKTCSVGTASGSTCTYTCTRACANLAAGDARDSFLGALQARGIPALERDLQVSAARRQPTLVAAMTITGCVARTVRYLMRRGKGNSSMKL
ncbi:hypothetical protein NXS19_008162 [Fusarium pseudograminearum]|nr:hypothetical protein NXS19_008162 [Fusarium pseudograminearum]